MCLYPRLIKNRKYTETKKNGGVIPAITDKRVLQVPIGCGKCIECMKQKTREWQARLLEEIRTNKTGIFVTLTFSDESIKELAETIDGLEGYNLDNEIATKAMRRFLERWRKKYKKSLKHWTVTELGHNGTENVHIHGIIWHNEKMERETAMQEIKEIWKYGFAWIGTEDGTNYVNEKTVNYITKYVNKVDEQHKYYKPKILTSAGIGKGYTDRADAEANRYKEDETKVTYTTRTGHEIALPIYWRNKIYSEDEREMLWIEKLDKKERWVMGEKIDVSTADGEREYYNTLKWYRAKNKRLGYGDDEKDWDKKRYENSRRQLKIEERIKRASPPLESGLPPSAGERIIRNWDDEINYDE